MKKKSKLEVKMGQPVVEGEFDPNMAGGELGPSLEESFKPNVAKPPAPPPAPEVPPPAGTDFQPAPIDLSGFGKEMEETGAKDPFTAAEVLLMENPQDKMAPEELSNWPQKEQPLSSPPMVQAPAAQQAQGGKAPAEEVAQFIQSKRQRPQFEDNSGWEAAQSAANAAIGFNPGKSVYALERERNQQLQEQFNQDRNAEQQLVMQAIQQKFSGRENELNRSADKEKFLANLTSEEMRALAQQKAQAEQARMLEEGRLARAEADRLLKEELFRQSESGRNARFEEGQEGADRRNAATNDTQREIANAAAVDRGTGALAKGIDAASIKEFESTAQKINGPEGQHLMEAISGWKTPANKVPGLNRAAFTAKQRAFAAEYKQSLLKMRHDLLGASQTPAETAFVNEAYDMGLSGDPAVAAQAYNRLLKMYNDKATQTAAGVRPESVQRFRQQGGYIPVMPEDDFMDPAK